MARKIIPILIVNFIEMDSREREADWHRLDAKAKDGLSFCCCNCLM